MPPVFSEPPVGTIFGEEEIREIERVLREGGSLTRGKDVTAFEEEFAAFCGVPHAVSTSSGTAALQIAAQLLRIKKGDEVIVPVTSFWNTVVPYVENGATIRVADVDGYTLSPNPDHIESLITKNTKAIMLLSLGGDPCDYQRIMEIGKKHGIAVVEDAAHSVGALYQGKKVGSFCDISCFSFASLKNMSTLGEGGMLVTPHAHFAEEAAKLRECWPLGKRTPRASTSFGSYAKPPEPNFMRAGDAFDFDWQELEELGTNYKMTSVAAAVGRVQLKKVEQFNAKRAEVALQYDQELQKIPGFAPRPLYKDSVSSHHLYNFFLTESSGVDRDQLVAELKRKHNMSYIQRFWPIHLHGVLRMQGHQLGETPVYEKLWFKEMMSLPIAPTLDHESVQWVIDRVTQTCEELRT